MGGALLIDGFVYVDINDSLFINNHATNGGKFVF